MSDQIPTWAAGLQSEVSQTRRDIHDVSERLESRDRLLFGEDNDGTGIVSEVRKNSSWRESVQGILRSAGLILIGVAVSGIVGATLYLVRATGPAQ